VTADAFTVGAYVRGGTNSPRVLCAHADLFAAFADGTMIERELTDEAYLSHFAFADDYRAHFAANRGSVAGFVGPCWCRWLVLDIDRSDPAAALADARKLVAFVHRRYPDLEGDVPVYFSGNRGYHVLLELAHRPPPAVGFHHTAKALALALAGAAGVGIDPSVYDIAHPIRLPNTRHLKSGLYKRRLDADALFRLDVAAVRGHARHPAGDGIPTASGVPEELVRDWAEAQRHAARSVEVQAERRAEHAGAPDFRAPKYFLDFIRFGVGEGERHTTLFRMAAWMTEQGAPEHLCHSMLTEAGEDVGLMPKDVERQIRCGIEHAARQRAATPPPPLTPSEPPPPSALADDPDAFFGLMSSRGWKWPAVLSWLNAPPTAGFFELTPDGRRRAADHLERLPPAARGEGGRV
jgi:hypothetical protein